MSELPFRRMMLTTARRAGLAPCPATPKGTAVTGSDDIKWLHDWDEAIAQARRTRQPIVIDVYQDN